MPNPGSDDDLDILLDRSEAAFARAPGWSSTLGQGKSKRQGNKAFEVGCSLSGYARRVLIRLARSTRQKKTRPTTRWLTCLAKKHDGTSLLCDKT